MESDDVWAGVIHTFQLRYPKHQTEKPFSKWRQWQFCQQKS